MSKTKTKVISPIALNEKQLARLEKVIKKIAGEDIVVKSEVNEAMVSGIKIIIGTKTIDLSLDNIVKELTNKINEQN